MKQEMGGELLNNTGEFSSKYWKRQPHHNRFTARFMDKRPKYQIWLAEIV